MITHLRVQGTQPERPLEVEVNVDTVYIRSNISRVETEDFIGWQYDEIQYSTREYISSLAEKKQVEEVQSKLLNADEHYQRIDKTAISLEELKVFKINQLKYLCSNSIYEGFYSMTTGHSFSFDEQAQANFTQQLLLIVSSNGNYTDKIYWKTKSMDIVELTPIQFIAIVTEAKDYKVSQQSKYWELEQQVLSSKTKDEVYSIVW